MKKLKHLAKYIYATTLVITFSFFGKVASAYADLAPDPFPHSRLGGEPVRSVQASFMTVSILIYIVGTIIFELPVYLFMKFRSKKALLWITFVNVVSVTLLQMTNFATGGAVSGGLSLVLAEIVVVIFEAIILVGVLKGEKVNKILLAVVLANISSAIIGTSIFRFIGII